MDPHEDVVSIGMLVSELFPRTVVDEAAEAIAATDSVAYTVAPPALVSAGALSDYLEGAGFLFVEDLGHVSSTAHPSTRVYPMLVADALRVSDNVYPGLTVDTADGGVLSAELFERVASVLFDTGAVAATAHPRTVSTPTLISAGVLSDSLDPAKILDVVDTGALGASLHPSVSVVALLTSTGAVSAEAVLQTGVLEVVISSGTLSDSVSAQSVLYPLLVDSADGWGAVFAEGSTAWAANTDNWAASRYEPYDFRSVASFAGALYAAGGPGLVRVGAENDGGAEVRARVESHLTDFGEEKLKMPRALYLGYTSNQALTVTLSATDDGQETAYEYFAEPRLAETHVPGRIALGRGLRSRYLRFILANESGGDFAVDSAYIDADVSERRI